MRVADAPTDGRTPTLGVERLREMYRQLWRIRLFEEAVLDLFKKGEIRGTAHLYIGTEAVAVGACTALRPTDYITSTHRGHGHALAKGLEPGPMLAEILGRATGYCKGKGGSMHVASPALGMLGADGIVAGGTPIAAGAALGARVLGRDDVTLCFFGDGAANQGVLFESLNLASVLHLPVIYICENNLWALTTPASATTSVADVASRGAAFGMPGVVVDGQDAVAVYEAVARAVARARAGEGPSLLECKTYRYFSHSAFATREVRPQDEIAHWKARDPIALLGARLAADGRLSRDEAAAIEAEERALIAEVVEAALAAPPADPNESFTDVFTPTSGGANGSGGVR
jgi:TPP-dependent pyruvate/acetoin dehydrogenase alpha subunit